MDSEFTVRILQFRRTRVGGIELVPAPEAPAEWQLIGSLVAAFGVTEEPPMSSGQSLSSAQRYMRRDRYDALPSDVAPVASPAEDLISLDGVLGSEENDHVTLPPWLSMQGIFPEPPDLDADAESAAQVIRSRATKDAMPSLVSPREHVSSHRVTR